MTATFTIDMIPRGACKGQLDLFREKFPNGAPMTVDAAVSVASDFDWDWIARRALKGKWFAAYREQLATIDAAYREQLATIDAAYMAQLAPTHAAYRVQRAPIDAAYREQRATIFATLFIAQQAGEQQT